MADNKQFTRYKIKADILSLEKGIEHFEGLKAIRIVSKTYNLLIMDDYLSLIGEIDGDLFLISPTEVVREFKNIQGFYRLSKNTFEFILKNRGQSAKSDNN